MVFAEDNDLDANNSVLMQQALETQIRRFLRLNFHLLLNNYSLILLLL